MGNERKRKHVEATCRTVLWCLWEVHQFSAGRNREGINKLFLCGVIEGRTRVTRRQGKRRRAPLALRPLRPVLIDCATNCQSYHHCPQLLPTPHHLAPSSSLRSQPSSKQLTTAFRKVSTNSSRSSILPPPSSPTYPPSTACYSQKYVLSFYVPSSLP